MGLRAGILLLRVCWLLSMATNSLEDGKCFFPFRYNKGVFYDCIMFESKHKWCSLTATFKGYWKYCSADDVAKCVFPFWYRRTIYWECTEDSDAFGKKWCSLTQNYNKEKVWKYCGS
ncbi:binder of sperm protein homolog 1 [Pteronotus mesoamericanus]|uniref:binder of sperm protein homolog 1 n=1 Tax=Pteronotus mesoamericanus TaxID=1884717 RepID=UPI0023EB4AE2|nr:binder of sperm protein homolog 1 [Pteronotus parnellii mesoamericanus]